MNSQLLPGVVFTEIIPPFLPEVNVKKMVELGTIVLKKRRAELYEPLADSLRKIQWVKLTGLKAIAIEKRIFDKMEPNTLVMDPMGQVAHALCVTDCMIHTKSALDSIAVFLTSLLKLNAKGGNRDFKKRRFRKLVVEKDPFLKNIIDNLGDWFRQLQKIRDEWIHRGSIRSLLIQGASEVGVLPIPKEVELKPDEQDKLAITRENFWSTRDFVENHYSNLIALFLAIVDRCIQIEREGLSKPVSIDPEAEKSFSMFPFRLKDKRMLVKRTKVKIPKSNVDW